MSFFDKLKGLFETKSYVPDYRKFTNERLLELWAARSTLTDVAREILKAELTDRNLMPSAPRASPIADPPPGVHTLRIGDRTIDFSNGPFADIAPFLKVQLFSETGRTDYVALLDRESFVMREVVSGISAVLVLDFGADETTVSAAAARRWGRSFDELFDVAWQNLANQQIQALQIDLHGHRAITLAGNGSFVSPLALAADQWASATGAPMGTLGLLVSVPNWHSFFLYVIKGPEVREVIEPLRRLTRTAFESMHDPVSSTLFWFRPRGRERAADKFELPSWIPFDDTDELPEELEDLLRAS